MCKLTQVLGNFEDQPWAAVGDFESIQDGWKLVFELHVNDGTNDGNDFAIGSSGSGSGSSFRSSSGAQLLSSVQAS